MGLRIHKRIKVAPGLTLNLSKNGHSVTVGGGGVSANIKKGKVSGTVGVPGSGVYYRTNYTEPIKFIASHPLGFIEGCAVLLALYIIYIVVR